VSLLLAPSFAAAESLPSLPVPAVSKEDHVLGRRLAPVSLIVYTDLECPYCANFHPTLKKAIRAMRGKVNVIYRHFPLSFHSSAKSAALASECVASAKGNAAFWQFIENVFDKGAELYEQEAKTMGMDVAALRACMETSAIKEKVTTQSEQAKDALSGTPTTFLVNKRNGKVSTVEGSQPFDILKEEIQAILK
jgi:protein-disulfide isomerase